MLPWSSSSARPNAYYMGDGDFADPGSGAEGARVAGIEGGDGVEIVCQG